MKKIFVIAVMLLFAVSSAFALSNIYADSDGHSLGYFDVQMVSGYTTSTFVKIYNPMHYDENNVAHMNYVTVSISFINSQKFMLDSFSRSSDIFPELFYQEGDSTVFRETYTITPDTYNAWEFTNCRITH